MDETRGEPARDRGFKARKREDHALQLIERLKESLDDVIEARKILRELGRYYDPVLGGAIMVLLAINLAPEFVKLILNQ